MPAKKSKIMTKHKKNISTNKFKPPVSEGQEYDLEIAGEKRGSGFALVKNFLVFVPNSSKGDFVHVKIKEVKQDYAVGRIMSTEEPMSLGENLKEQYEEAEEMAAAGLLQQPEEEE